MCKIVLPRGTRVRLNSGGPDMCVVAVDDRDYEARWCAWSAGEAKFHIATLTVIEERASVQHSRNA